MRKLKARSKLAIITVPYHLRYNIGNFHLNDELARRFDQVEYFNLKEDFDTDADNFKDFDMIFINRPLRKVNHAKEGKIYNRLDFNSSKVPVVLFDTDTTMLKMKERIRILKKIGVDYLLLGNNDNRLEKHRKGLPNTKCEWFPFGVNTKHFYDYKEERTIPYGFIGSFRNHHYPKRRELVNHFNHRLGDRFFFKRMIKEEYVDYLNKIKIFVTANDLDAGFFMKHLEVMACGCMLLAEYTPLLTRVGFIDGHDFISWTTISECEMLALHYGTYDEEREIVARHGQSEARKHTWKKRVDWMMRWLNATGNISGIC